MPPGDEGTGSGQEGPDLLAEALRPASEGPGTIASGATAARTGPEPPGEVLGDPGGRTDRLRGAQDGPGEYRKPWTIEEAREAAGRALADLAAFSPAPGDLLPPDDGEPLFAFTRDELAAAIAAVYRCEDGERSADELAGLILGQLGAQR